MASESVRIGIGINAVARNARSRLERAWGESPFYQAQLDGPAPDRFLISLMDPFAAEPAIGREILSGKFANARQEIDCEGELPTAFDRVVGGDPLFRELHGFAFLRPLSALGEQGPEAAIELIDAWLKRHEKWSSTAWDPAIVGDRLMSLAQHGRPLLSGFDPTGRSRLLASMARQTRHLTRTGHRIRSDRDRLMAAFALCAVSLVLPGCQDPLQHGLGVLRRELRVQLRPDGGHLSRNPTVQLSIVAALGLLIDAFRQRRIETPGFLVHIHSRARGHLALFRMPDGRLATFNDGYEGDGRALGMALNAADVSSSASAVHGNEPAMYARHSGFQRLATGNSVLVADVGVDAGERGSTVVGRAGGSFNFAVGRNRVVVNCGSGGHLSDAWRKALRHAAASSTLAPDVDADGIYDGADLVASHRRAEDFRGQLLEIERKSASGDLHHTRRIFLSANGGDLRGEDAIRFASADAVPHWRLRFHLHPDVAAHETGPGEILLKPGRGEAWRFRADRSSVALEDSVYCGAASAPSPTKQIVISLADLEPAPSGDIIIKWGLRKAFV